MDAKLTRFKRRLYALAAGKNFFRGRGFAVVMISLILYSALMIAWTPYAGASPVSSNQPSSISSGALQPKVTVNSIFPESVIYGQIFDLVVSAGNTGNAPANNVHIIFTANPKGFFIIQNVDQPACALGQDCEDVSLGTLAPNSFQEINFMLQVPTQTQVAGVWSQNFRFDLTATYDNNVTSYAGCVVMIIRHGKLMLSKKGVGQD